MSTNYNHTDDPAYTDPTAYTDYTDEELITWLKANGCPGARTTWKRETLEKNCTKREMPSHPKSVKEIEITESIGTEDIQDETGKVIGIRIEPTVDESAALPDVDPEVAKAIKSATVIETDLPPEEDTPKPENAEELMATARKLKEMPKDQVKELEKNAADNVTGKPAFSHPTKVRCETPAGNYPGFLNQTCGAIMMPERYVTKDKRRRRYACPVCGTKRDINGTEV